MKKQEIQCLKYFGHGIKCNIYVYLVSFTDIEAVPFNRGFYSIDLRYFFKITLKVFTGVGKPTEVEGLATFSKKVILFGSDGNAKIFSSKYKQNAFDPQQWRKTNLPYAVVEVVEPIVLGEKLVDVRQNTCCCDDDLDIASVPESVSRVFDDPIVIGGEAKRAFVSIGIFSIIKLERRVQLLIPSYDYCVPKKQCVGATEDDPCDLFDRIEFPMDEFYPPEKCTFLEPGQMDPSVTPPAPPCQPCCPPCPPPCCPPPCCPPKEEHEHNHGSGNSRIIRRG